MGLSGDSISDCPAVNGIVASKESDADVCNFLKINGWTEISQGRLMAARRRFSHGATDKAQLYPCASEVYVVKHIPVSHWPVINLTGF
jgi:hypothetical protein